jgi:hypothetical protein
MEKQLPIHQDVTMKAAESSRAALLEVDAALAADETAAAGGSLEDPGADRGGKLGRLLRIIGSAVLIAAAMAFLVQRWGSMNDILRYVSFLGFTAVLTGAGFLCGVRIKEDKGARTFLSLAAGMVTVNFAQLGALIFSTTGHREMGMIPGVFLWRAPSLTAALLTMAGAIAVLIPVTYVSMRVMMRGRERLMTFA